MPTGSEANRPTGCRTALVTGATGFIGSRLAEALAARGWQVRCLVRDRSRAGSLADHGFDLHVGDVLDPRSLEGAGEGVEVAYYLVHAMGRGGRGDFEERERRGARNFAEMAKREGVERVLYLGGLGDRPKSKHLRSRQRTAELLAEHGPPLIYFRAGMVVGAGSESYRTLRYLVQRLPAMIAPAWLATPTQPIAIDDVVEYLAQAPDVVPPERSEIQIGGPDVLSYGEMLDRMAEALGIRPRRRVPVPLLTPRLSSLWIGLVTPVDAGVARPLVEGLSTPTVVTDRSGAALFEIAPIGFMEALRRALAEDPEVEAGDRVGARLLSDETLPVPRRGPVESIARAELLLPGRVPAPGRSLLQRAGRAYWAFVARGSLRLIRADEGPDGGIALFLRGTRLALLRFGAPRYEPLRAGGSITWGVAGGLLVSRRGRGRGFLRLMMERSAASDDPGLLVIRVTMEVGGFYPSLRGEGILADLGARIYGATQRRVHRAITAGFLRSLAGLELANG